MPVVAVVLLGLLGLAIGSFLNVVIWRVPRGESVVSPPSHCPSCDAEIAPRDNVPVVSWLVLRGRCRHCRAQIAWRYPAVELATCALFVAFAVRFGAHVDVVAFLYLAAVGVALAVIDFDHKRLPDPLTLPSYVVAAALLGLAAGLGSGGGGGDYARALIGMAALFGFYGIVWFIYPAGMGLGDVKLAGVLGLYLAWLGWGQLVVGAFAAFLVGAVVSVAVVLARGGGRKTQVPFGPFMLVGVLIGIYAGHPLAHSYTHSLTH
ncbi:MAG TPA: prepilin peptidase [Mycobacteriales bacterium]|nr:prepilin peptidase [Mycobacteriales bacterium]